MRAQLVLLALTFGLRAQEVYPIVVRVYAYATAPSGSARLGEEIFRRAGMETRWTECTPALRDCGELHEGDLLIKVVSRTWKGGPKASAFGTAVIDRHSYLGWVFLDRVRQAAREHGARPGTVLAHVIAHEVAHLLGLQHTERGIMRAGYEGAEIRATETGALGFSVEEGAELRAGATRRRERQIESRRRPPSLLP